MIEIKKCYPLGVLALTLLSACGGGEDSKPVEVISPFARADILLSSERGMESVAVDSKNAYLSLTNTATEGSAVLHAVRNFDATSTWQAVNLGECGLAKNDVVETRRAGHLKQLGDKIVLMQPAYNGPQERTLCSLEQDTLRFVPKDKDFKYCFSGYCEVMSPDDVQAVGNRWYANAGGAPNLQVSTDQGTSWRAVLGAMEGMSCYNQAFHLVGNRVLVGGECPLDVAYVRAYQLNADNTALASASAAPLAVTVPELENRNVQFITSFANSERVFAGVEGGLLRSDDGGRSFKFVIRQPVEGATNYPYITRLLSPAGKPNVLVASGFDKAKGVPYLVWSADNGDKWTDLSSLLPGFKRTSGDGTAQVTSMVEDAQGRILVTVNEQFQSKGRLVAVKLGELANAQ